MSRIGKMPVVVPQGVNVELNGLNIKVTGPKGELNKKFFGDISIKFESNQIRVNPLNDSKQAKAMWGTVRSIINNMVKGVTEGFLKKLVVDGVGYKAVVKGNYLNLALGKSHNTKIEIPLIMKIETPKQDTIISSSIDNQKLGQFNAVIKRQRPKEPYKLKGIGGEGDYARSKKGKKK